MPYRDPSHREPGRDAHLGAAMHQTLQCVPSSVSPPMCLLDVRVELPEGPSDGEVFPAKGSSGSLHTNSARLSLEPQTLRLDEQVCVYMQVCVCEHAQMCRVCVHWVCLEELAAVCTQPSLPEASPFVCGSDGQRFCLQPQHLNVRGVY